MKYDEQAACGSSQHSRQALVGREQERAQFDDLLAEMENTISSLFRREVETTPSSEVVETAEINPRHTAQPGTAPMEIIEPVTEPVVEVRQESPLSPPPASAEVGKIIEGDRGPVKARAPVSGGNGSGNGVAVNDNGGGGGFHQRVTAVSFSDSFKNGVMPFAATSSSPWDSLFFSTSLYWQFQSIFSRYPTAC